MLNQFWSILDVPKQSHVMYKPEMKPVPATSRYPILSYLLSCFYCMYFLIFLLVWIECRCLYFIWSVLMSLLRFFFVIPSNLMWAAELESVPATGRSCLTGTDRRKLRPVLSLMQNITLKLLLSMYRDQTSRSRKDYFCVCLVFAMHSMNTFVHFSTHLTKTSSFSLVIWAFKENLKTERRQHQRSVN
jgi:hypothetical protein